MTTESQTKLALAADFLVKASEDLARGDLGQYAASLRLAAEFATEAWRESK